jgi:hypothetical protein
VVYDNAVVTTVIAPLVGLRLPDERWELGSGIALVRGDMCDAPPEAVWSGSDEAQPNALVEMSVESTPNDPPPLSAARLAFRKLLTALRLFKAGAASLGPSAWWRLDDGPWQQLPLGSAGRPRAGGYSLERAERDDLAELFEFVRQRPIEGGALPWALARFEMGCEQLLPVEGLSDHLLSLRALLDGNDESPADISSRLAALCAEGATDRARLRSMVQQAFELERLIMHGHLDSDHMKLIGCGAPLEVVEDLEGHLRAILKDMVSGYLDAEIKRAADDLLRREAEARPKIDQSDELGPAEPGQKGKRRPRKAPTLESWEEVPVSIPAEAAEPPEPEFVVRRASVSERSAPKRRKRAQLAGARQASTRRSDEQPTEENVAVGGVRELVPDADDPLDWGFDDDPADYSAAV